MGQPLQCRYDRADWFLLRLSSDAQCRYPDSAGDAVPYRAFYPTHANIIQIDINPGSLGAHCPVNMALVGDIKTTLTALLPQLDAKSDRAFLDKALEHYRTTRQDLDARHRE